MNLKDLAEPFEADAVEWRVGQSGIGRDGKPWAKLLAYLTNRAIMDRLDSVCGPENWRNEFAASPNDPKHESCLCGISIRINGEWITKWDGADNTDFEPTKGGLSDSMKRAAVHWGIGRYLYQLGETWAECTTEKMRGKEGWRFGKTKDGKEFYWHAPDLDPKFLPDWTATKPEQIITPENDLPPIASTAEPELPEGDWRVRPFEAKGGITPDQHLWYLDRVHEVLGLAGCKEQKQKDGVLKWVTGPGYTDKEEGYTFESIEDPQYAQAAWLRMVQRSAKDDPKKWLGLARKAATGAKKAATSTQASLV